MTATDAKHRLVRGNGQFISQGAGETDLTPARRLHLSHTGQHPFAIIVCCSDSRVPPELIFDQGLGDLFVVRTAGHVLDTAAMGSLEFGVSELHVPLIVVMGHENCGAVKAAVDGGQVEGTMAAVLKKIAPAKEAAKAGADPYTACENEHIKNTVREISQNTVISRAMASGAVTVQGAKYRLASGEVEFF